jgi:hypothetical protein
MKAIPFFVEDGCPPYCPWIELGIMGHCACADVEWASPILRRFIPGPACPVPDVPEPKDGHYDLVSLGKFVMKLRKKYDDITAAALEKKDG